MVSVLIWRSANLLPRVFAALVVVIFLNLVAGTNTAFSEESVRSAASSVEVALGVSGLTAQTQPDGKTEAEQKVNEWIDDVSFGFVPNRGQISNVDGKSATEVLFSANVMGAQVYVTNTGMSHYFLKRIRKGVKNWTPKKEHEEKQYEWCRLDLDLQGASIDPERVRLEDPISGLGSNNYYLANCPDGVLDVPTYGKITFSDIYPGIDWVVLSRPGQQVQHDFIVHPGADAANIQMRYIGASEIELSDDSLLLHVRTPLGEVREGTLHCYQGDPQNKVGGRFIVNGDAVSFLLDNYDRSQPLVIDPPLLWSTYYGGSNFDGPRTVLCDNTNDHIYVVGYTASTDLPVQNAGGGSYYQGTLASGLLTESFIWKFTQAGVRVWATYYGGSGYETNADCALDNFNNLYICGATTANDFPTQVLGGAYNQAANGGAYDSYVLKFNSLGVRQWATYYGGNGSDQASGITTDASGRVYVCGITSSNNLTLVNPGGGAYFQSTPDTLIDAFILRFSSLGALQWATYFGGIGGNDEAYGITTSIGNLYVTGLTQSSSFPTLNPGGGAYFDGTLNGIQDAFISKFNLAGVMSWSTYYGGNGEDSGDEPVVDGNGSVFNIGYTNSTDLPTLNPAGNAYYQGANGGSFDLYILKFNSSNASTWATYYGGSSDEFLQGGFGKPITLDLQGRLYATACTFSSNFPVLNPGGGSFYQGTLNGPMDALIGQFSNTGIMIWSTFFGGTQPDFGTGVSIGNQGCLFATGEAIGAGSLFTVNPGFGAYYQVANAGSDDGYITKFCSANSACCLDFTCVPVTSQSECTSLGGTAFYANQPCSTTVCSILCNICGKKYNDLNRNGIQDGGEPGLSGWTIQLYYWNGPLYATTTTDSIGNYCFNDIPCGAWTVTEQLQQNWVQTYPSPNVHTYTMGASSTLTGINFGNSSCVADTCCVKPAAGMIAWYPFDEQTPGVANDIAAKTRDGWHYFDQLVHTEGIVGGAIALDSSRYVRVFDDPFAQIDSGDFSIDVWIKPSSFAAECQNSPYTPCAAIPILDNRSGLTGADGDNGIMLYLKRISPTQARLGLAMNVFPSHQDIFETASAPVALNEWQHVAVTVYRNGGSPLGTFYYNGDSIGTFTPTLGQVYSTSPPGSILDIGHGPTSSSYGSGQSCLSQERYYAGLLDELEIWKRWLSTTEINRLYAAGSRGKCKISCAIPSSVVLCRTATTVTMNLTVCNQTPNTSIAKFSFAPLASASGCNFNATGITFSPANGILTLLPGQCTQIPVTLSRPLGFVPGNVACFCVTVQDTLTKSMSTCCSKLVASNAFCATLSDPIDITTLSNGQAHAFSFTVRNETDSPATFDYTLRAEGNGEGSDPTAIGLNGLPPGVVVPGSVTLSPWSETVVSGDAVLGTYRPMDLESILLEADVDGNGVTEPIGTVLIQAVSFADCNGNAIDDALDLSFGTSPDANGNGFPDECEVPLSNAAGCFICGDADGNSQVNISDVVFLINYIFAGGPAPNPLVSGDADCNGIVNITDAVYSINYIFGGGPQPCAACP